MQKLWQYLFKVDKAAESLSVKVSKLEASCVSKTQFCDQKKVRNLEHKIDVHSQKVDQYVAQNLKISRNLSDKMVRMEKQMEILFQNILSWNYKYPFPIPIPIMPFVTFTHKHKYTVNNVWQYWQKD